MRIAQLVFLFLSALLIHGSTVASEEKSLIEKTSKRPPLMLANVYHPGIDLNAYWVSEKYDGIRAYWDGSKLWTRGGETITAPSWFVIGWPKTPLDGELWAGRGGFAYAVSTARRQTPDDDAWRKMHFMVFDLPAHQASFDARLPILISTVHAIGLPWVQAVKQEKISDHRTLQKLLKKITKEGGEGLMLHRGTSLYRPERNDDLLKLKLHEDAEAKVMGYVPGKGRHQGRLGALLVQTVNGQGFKLGSGFSDAERNSPPPLGSWVTYRFRGVNESGIPRFASFLRIREDMEVQQNQALQK